MKVMVVQVTGNPHYAGVRFCHVKHLRPLKDSKDAP